MISAQPSRSRCDFVRLWNAIDGLLLPDLPNLRLCTDGALNCYFVSVRAFLEVVGGVNPSP